MSRDWFWLSFCDPKRPHGEQFLGASIVGPAEDLLHAVQLAHARKCNPGGEVMGLEIAPDIALRIPPSYRHRLLSRADADALDAILGPP